MGKPGRKPMDVAGQRFGKLTAEKYVPNTKKRFLLVMFLRLRQ